MLTFNALHLKCIFVLNESRQILVNVLWEQVDFVIDLLQTKIKSQFVIFNPSVLKSVLKFALQTKSVEYYFVLNVWVGGSEMTEKFVRRRSQSIVVHSNSKKIPNKRKKCLTWNMSYHWTQSISQKMIQNIKLKRVIFWYKQFKVKQIRIDYLYYISPLKFPSTSLFQSIRR